MTFNRVPPPSARCRPGSRLEKAVLDCMSKEQISEMRKLRATDLVTWTANDSSARLNIVHRAHRCVAT
ncbi:hypothetical protein PsYK624_111710 [Phanerochaete sordida]|uniref:Uncharacterized protein n=1 Tax=Phanerochaete sordida TaxID=48140 RepID=A0A9P3LHH9_9APHY|nr:hypothetical protein PsYK624_111710 [Phanerochaete sordida]